MFALPKTSWLFGVCAFVFLYASSTFGCSILRLSGPDGSVVTKSYDWYWWCDHGMGYLTPAGVTRTGLTAEAAENPETWISIYPNLTFTQFGLGLPIGGMNGRGLVVEMLQLDDTVYNGGDTSLPYVNEGQLTAFLLDTAANVGEALEKLKTVRVVGALTGIHYFISDADGNSAVAEFLDGKLTVRTGTNLPVAALTNDTYEHLIDDWNKNGASDPAVIPVRKRTSESRFRTAARAIRDSDGGSLPELTRAAKSTLDNVRIDGFSKDAVLEPSKWSLVYSPKQRRVEYRTAKSENWKTIDLNELDLDNLTETKMIDMNDAAPKFIPYTKLANDRLIAKNWLVLNGQRQKLARQVGDSESCGRRVAGVAE